MSETRETAIKRLRMRSWRRGIKEMDLILGGFADRGLDGLSNDELVLYDEMLEENDHDLYQWSSGQSPAPQAYAELLDKVLMGMRTKEEN